MKGQKASGTGTASIDCTIPQPVGLVLDIKAGQLCLAGRHTISFYSSNAHLTAEPTFACPHQDLLSLVPENRAANDLQMYQTLISSKPHQDLLSLIPGKLVKACPRCPTLIAKETLPKESEKMNQSVFWVLRNLGSCEWGNLGFTELSASKHRTLSGKGIRFLAKCRQCLSTYIYLVCIIWLLVCLSFDTVNAV
jgi:hypothetical protein